MTFNTGQNFYYKQAGASLKFQQTKFLLNMQKTLLLEFYQLIMTKKYPKEYGQRL